MVTAGRSPILRMGDNLLAGLQSELDDTAILAFADELTQRIADTGARGVLLDISRLELVDSFIGRILVEITTAARLLGARVIVAGMRPAVAMTLAQLGLPLPDLETALTTEQAMEKLAVGRAVDRRPPVDTEADDGRQP